MNRRIILPTAASSIPHYRPDWFVRRLDLPPQDTTGVNLWKNVGQVSCIQNRAIGGDVSPDSHEAPRLDSRGASTLRHPLSRCPDMLQIKQLCAL